MRPYRLADGAYLCASEEGAVFLDLKSGCYTGLDAEQSAAMSAIVEGWPSPLGEAAAHLAEALLLAETLCEQRLLARATPASAQERTAQRATSQLPEVTSELIAWHEMTWRDVRIDNVYVFIRSMIVACAVLRLRQFESVVKRARSRKLRRTDAKSFRVDHLRPLLSAFFHIRTLFYAPKGNCLRDSLILLEFLAHYGVFPTWVIGVQIKPFGAHSWLQHSSFVLNGTVPFVRSYRPILVV